MSETAQVIGKFEDGITGPLSGVVNLFSRLERGFDKLSEKLEPLTGKAEALVVALGAEKIFSGSIEAAQKEVEAEAVLLNALRGRQETLKQINAGIAEITETTTASREELVRLAATFANAGISAELIPEALRASLETAKALDKPVQAIASEIIKAQSGKGGRIASAIPELKEILDVGGNAADVIRLLNERFAGTAEAVAKTPFGRVAQGMRDIEDIAQDLGKELVKLKAAAVDALLEDLRKLDAGLGSNGFQAILNILVQLVPYAVRFAEVLVGLATAAQVYKFGAFIFGLVGPLASIAATIAVISAGALGLVGLIDLLSGNAQVFEKSSDAVALAYHTASEEVGTILERLAKGQITIANVFDFMETKVKNLGLFLKGFLIDPIINYVVAIKDAAVGAAKSFWYETKLASVEFVDFLQKALLNMIRGLAGALDSIINGTIKGLNLLPGVSIAYTSGLARNVPKVFTDLSGSIDETTASLADAVDLMKNAFPNAAKQTAIDANAALDAIVENNVALDQRMNDAVRKNVELRKQERDKEFADELTRAKRLDAELASGGRSLTQASRGAVEADPQLKAQLLREQAQEQDAIVAAATAERNLAVEKLQVLQASLGAQAASLEGVRAENDAKSDVAAKTQQLLQAERERARIATEMFQTQKELQDIVRRSAESEISGLSAARQAAVAQLQRDQADREAGYISKGQRLLQDQQALEQYAQKATEARAAIEKLASQLPPEEADKLHQQLQNLERDLTPPAETDRGFFTGVVDGIRSATAEMDNLGRVGSQVGSTLANGLTDGIINVFIRGKEGVREWAAELLQQVATILERMLILQAIEATTVALGFNSGGYVQGFAGGGTVAGARTGYDSVSAKLTPGEYVHNTSAVDYYGHGVMHAINQRMIPRELFAGVRSSSAKQSSNFGGFAGGGPVPTPISPRRSAGAATIVSSEQEMDRLLAGAAPAMERFLDRRGYKRGGGR